MTMITPSMNLLKRPTSLVRAPQAAYAFQQAAGPKFGITQAQKDRVELAHDAEKASTLVNQHLDSSLSEVASALQEHKGSAIIRQALEAILVDKLNELKPEPLQPVVDAFAKAYKVHSAADKRRDLANNAIEKLEAALERPKKLEATTLKAMLMDKPKAIKRLRRAEAQQEALREKRETCLREVTRHSLYERTVLKNTWDQLKATYKGPNTEVPEALLTAYENAVNRLTAASRINTKHLGHNAAYVLGSALSSKED